MKYGIARVVSQSPGFIEMSREEFEKIRRARKHQFVILEIEDKFDIILSNYSEYEQALLELALRKLVYHEVDWGGFQAGMQLVNRRLGNLLSAARLYLDQVPHDLKALDDIGSTLTNEFHDECSKQYDTKFGYRVMEAARNFAQHRALTVTHLSYSMRPDQIGKSLRKLSIATIPSLDTVDLESEGGFKKPVLDELMKSDRYVPITPLVREYMEGIGEIQDRLRQLADPHVVVWETLLRAVERRGQAAFPDHQLGLSIVCQEDDGAWPEVYSIFSDPWNRRLQLRRKNQGLRGLSKRFVTGVATDDRKNEDEADGTN